MIWAMHELDNVHNTYNRRNGFDLSHDSLLGIEHRLHSIVYFNGGRDDFVQFSWDLFVLTLPANAVLARRQWLNGIQKSRELQSPSQLTNKI